MVKKNTKIILIVGAVIGVSLLIFLIARKTKSCPKCQMCPDCPDCPDCSDVPNCCTLETGDVYDPVNYYAVDGYKDLCLSANTPSNWIDFEVTNNSSNGSDAYIRAQYTNSYSDCSANGGSVNILPNPVPAGQTYLSSDFSSDKKVRLFKYMSIQANYDEMITIPISYMGTVSNEVILGDIDICKEKLSIVFDDDLVTINVVSK